jgi:(E)-4-hydroxy-3-methylbut-2-enyl-diphosphate synthase
MGCAVNGPGEAKEADLGIAGGKNEFLLFKKGIVIRKLKEDEVIEAVLKEIDSL